ncbi:MAG: cupin domain-containing protein [Candidatus Omnitrophota bacterium]
MKAISMGEMISYQKNSVVSKEILRKPGGTVTVFAFDRGEGLSEHTAPFDALVYILDGEARITVAGKPCLVRRGEWILMPAFKPHGLQARKRFKMLLILIKK